MVKKETSEKADFLSQKIVVEGINFTIKEMDNEEKKDFSQNHGNHLEGILRTRFGRKTKMNVDGLLSHKNGIYLGSQKFKSLAELKNIFSKVLKGTKPGEKLDE